MASITAVAARLLRKTPFRTFVLYPLITLIWELSFRQGRLDLQPIFFPLMLWGYLQYRLCGRYRIKRGGGGPGLEIPPERLVTTGPYAYTRNPMYLGHIIFLAGLTLTLKSLLAGLLTGAGACWFHARALKDERRMTERFGTPYVEYTASVKRWLPGLF